MKKILLFTGLLIFAFYSKAQVGDVEKNIAVKLLQKNIARAGLKPADLSNSIISGTYIIPRSNIRMVYVQQAYQGIPVYNQMQVLAFKNEQLVSSAGGRTEAAAVANINASPVPVVSAAGAVQAALAALKIKPSGGIATLKLLDDGKKAEFGKQQISLENITAELIWLPVGESHQLKLAWQVFVAPIHDEDYWLVNIDAANNSFINKQSLTVKCNWDNETHSLKKHLNKKQLAPPAVAENILVTLKDKTKVALSPLVVNTASYRVIKYPAESPIHPGGANVLVTDPWAMSPGNATTLGWHNDGATSYSNTRGNNVYAYEDRDANNLPGISETSLTVQPNLSFDFTPDFTLAPTARTTAPNQQFNTTNLFYWNNLMHDLSYIYGFDEASRNFQNDNQSRGGSGGDYVLAESQDGSGTNNANFSTPADGGRGRMQMYLWTAPTPDRDGDVDNGIVAHEYTHGISNRLTGNGSTCLTNAEQMGEGWSDYFGLMITHDWANALPGDGFSKPRGIGTYALNQPVTGTGIRQYRYCTDMQVNPLTYGDLATVVAPHGVGTIWCTTLWDMTWEIIQTQGINGNIFNIAAGGGNAIALKLVLEGLRLQPCSPGFIDGRNAILKADTLFFGAQYSCAIIKAFARRGMGIGASQGSSNSRTDQTLSFIDCSSATCNAPTGLTATAITTNSATTNWAAVAGASNYTVEYKLNTAAAWSTAVAATTATSANITGLAEATLYDWRVRSNCASGNSAYAPAQFTTNATAGCDAPAGLATIAITSSSATISWAAVASAVNYTVEYKLSSASTWTVLAPATTSTSAGITGLAAATAYDWRVLTNCAASSSAYAQSGFTTASPGCISQYDIAANGTASGAALIPLDANVTGLINPSGDNDYYKFVITTGGTATITLTTLPADYDIRLYRSNGTSQLAISQNGNTTSETISRNFSAGTYYLRVYGYNGASNANNCYTLNIATGTASFNANPVVEAINSTRVFPNPSSKLVTVSVGDLKGTAEILLYDIYGKLLSKNKTGQVNTKLDISLLPPGTYILRINNNGKQTNLKIVRE